MDLRTPLMAILLSAACSLSAQQCSNDTLLTYPKGDFVYSDPGFQDGSKLPCITAGGYSELVIPYRTYDQGARLLTLPDSTTLPVAKIHSVRIDNISNLPAGLCWTTIPSSRTVTDGETGVIVIKGTTTASSGVYPLNVSISIDVSGSGSFTHTGLLPDSYRSLLGQPVIRIADASGNCPSIN